MRTIVVKSDITIRDLTPQQMAELADFISAVFEQGRRPVYYAPDGTEPVKFADALGNEPANDPVPAPSGREVAPAAAPSTNVTVTASEKLITNVAAGKRDNRGVVWHPEHHSGTLNDPGINAKGGWKKRKGHDPKALEAYEAQFLNTAAPNGGTDQPTTAGSGGTSPEVANALAAMNGTAPGPVTQAPAAGTPGYDDLVNLWVHLIKTSKVDSRHENWIIQTYGGHITFGDTFKNDPVKRKAAYDYLTTLNV